MQGPDNNRRANDGHVYFGTLKHSLPDARGNLEILNDFILPPSVHLGTKRTPGNEAGKEKFGPQVILGKTGQKEQYEQKEARHRGRQLQIYYSVEEEAFMLEDLGVGMGTYLRVEKPVPLERTTLINIGSSLLLLSPMDQEEDRPLLKAKVCGGPHNGKMFVLDPKTAKSYVLGRSEDCDLHLADSVLS